MQITVQTITESAVDLADMKRSHFIDQSGLPGTELIRYVNMAYKDLYQQVILAKENYFTIPTSLVIQANIVSYNLPSDFYKLDGVDLALDTDGRYLTLRPFQFLERNKFRSSLNLATAPFGQIYRYMIVGDQIQFVPLPSQTATVQLWYTPEPVVITSLNQILSLPIGSDEYMSLYCACAMLTKEESDCSALDAKRLQVLEQMKHSLRDRDEGSANYVVDESAINSGALYPFRENY